MLAYSEASGLGRIVRAQLRAFAQQPGVRTAAPGELEEVFTAHHAVLLKTMALEGRGIAWLPESLIVRELQCGALVAAGPEAWSIPVEIRLYRQHAEMAAVAESLWQLAASRQD